MAKTRAQENRAIRQEALREQLSKQGHLQHVVDNINKMQELDEEGEFFKNSLEKLKVANEQRLRLINKYLPDLKNTEVTGDGGGTLTVTTTKYTND